MIVYQPQTSSSVNINFIWSIIKYVNQSSKGYNCERGCHGRDCMVVEFRAKFVSSNPVHGEVFSI